MIKKALIAVVLIIIVLVAGFICIGLVYPAVEYTTTVEINKPRDVTWQVMRERKDWIYGFKSYEQLSGAPNEPGSKGRVTVVRDGREMSMDTELIDVKPPESATTRFTSDGMVHNATVHLTESNGKTTVVSNEKLEGTNIIWRSIFAIFKSMIVDTSRKNFDGLKQAVESSQ
ncbi:MAG: hypothetical protein JO314_09925 [Acidobacteria bacterium]|nr:hypothetical protein [Acidobacteriota bacterium]